MALTPALDAHGRAFLLLARRPGLFLAVQAPPLVAALALLVVSARLAAGSGDVATLFWFVAYLAALAALLLALAAGARVAMALEGGHEADARATWRFLRARLRPLLVAGFGALALVAVGKLLLSGLLSIVATLLVRSAGAPLPFALALVTILGFALYAILLAGLLLVVPVALLQESPRGNVQRAFRLARGRWAPLFLTVLLAGLAVGLPFGLLDLVGDPVVFRATFGLEPSLLEKDALLEDWLAGMALIAWGTLLLGPVMGTTYVRLRSAASRRERKEEWGDSAA